MKIRFYACALVLFTLAKAKAEPITYTLTNIFAPLQVTGTVTTDGRSGSLSGADILSYTLEFGGLTPYVVTDQGVLDEGGLTADNSNLYFDFGSTNFQRLIFGVDALCLTGNGNCIPRPAGFQIAVGEYNAIQTSLTNQVIATAVTQTTPEPGSLLLALTGALTSVGALRRSPA